MKTNFTKFIFIIAANILAINYVFAQTCSPGNPVCVPSGGYAFFWSSDTDYGLRFNVGTQSYEFTGGTGGLNTMVRFSAVDGDISIPGGGALQVAGNKYAFQYASDPDFGLFFNETDEQYEFRNGDATPVAVFDAIRGNSAIGAPLNNDLYKLWVNINESETLSNTGILVDQSTDYNSTAYGIFVDVDASAGDGVGTRYGVYSDIDNFGTTESNSTFYGYYTSVDGNGSGNKYGLYSFVPSGGGTGTHYGVYSYADGDDNFAGYFNGQTYVSSRLGIGNANPLYNIDIIQNSDLRAVNVDNEYSGSSTTYGYVNVASNASASGSRYGFYNYMSNGSGPRYGMYNFITTSNSTSSQYGIYSFISSAATTANRYGIYSSCSGDGGYSGYFLGQVYVSSTGGLTVGTTTQATGYMVSVNGKMICEELKVQNSIDWPDYVFDTEYDLMSLEELEKNINEKRHLPGIPSADIVEKEGFHIGEMTNKMMEKIEELTLYTIQQQKEIEALKSQLEEIGK